MRALVAHCVERYGAECVHGDMGCGTSPTSPTGAGRPTIPAAAATSRRRRCKAALPDASVGGPATTGDLGPGRHGHEFLRVFSRTAGRRSTSSRFTPRAGASRPGGSTARSADPRPTRQSPSSLKMLREVHAALDAVTRTRDFVMCIVDECDASVPAHWGVYDNADFAYTQHGVLRRLSVQADEKLLDLGAAAPACTRRPPEAAASRASASSRARGACFSPRRGSRSRC